MVATRRIALVGGLAAPAAAATPFAYLWVLQVHGAPEPLTARVRLDMAIGMAVFGAPWMLAAWLLWRTRWRRAGARLSGMDGPAWLLATAAATLPPERRDWGAAMGAELAQITDRAARGRFAAGCARAALFPPAGNRAAVGIAGALAVAAIVTSVSLPPVMAVVLACALAGCLWLALRPPRWLLPDRHGRRFGIAMALALVAGLVLAARLGRSGVMGFLVSGPILVVLPGSAVAAAVGRSLRSGLWACAWATVLGAPLLIAVWLAEALRWHQLGRGLLLDADGPAGVGANLGDAVWWPLLLLALWAVPLGVLGAAAGSWRARRRRSRQHAGPAPAA